MNILVPDEWLRDFLKTSATLKQIAKSLSLCGPSVERIEKKGKTFVYSIEITTNRIDTASIYGIAREANAILPRFRIHSSLKTHHPKQREKYSNKVNYLDCKVDHNLCPRFTAVLIKNVQVKTSPSWMKERLELVRVRAINNVVDISNYIMHEIGQPVHTFDYDKIHKSKMILRKSKKGERIITLDGQTHELPGGDIVIEDGEGRLIDLAGIMGGENSQVDWNTKNVLIFVQTYNPLTIRRTSMALPKRTEAAVLFEKGLDSELVTAGITRALNLFVELTEGIPEAEILDLYPEPYKPKSINTSYSFITDTLGVEIQKGDISRLLLALGFKTSWNKDLLNVKIPSFRAQDIQIEKDIIEEIARIYGYHNLPSRLMVGRLPDPLDHSPFAFEMKIKQILKGYGGIEVYTSSLVSEEEKNSDSLKLKNPLGKESEYIRTSLMPSLIAAASSNRGITDPFHLFEMANVYLPVGRQGLPSLPEEKMIIAGVFSNHSFREAKGVVEALMDELNIAAEFIAEDANNFLPSQRVVVKTKGNIIGELGTSKYDDLIYYEFDLDSLRNTYKPTPTFTSIPKYPAQIEDLTLNFPERTRVAQVIESIHKSNDLIDKVRLVDIYKDSYTFRIWYQHPDKTLTDQEVEQIRKGLLQEVKKKFGGVLKN